MSALGGTWEMVVGLEVHTELKTATKLFCGCANAFGGRHVAASRQFLDDAGARPITIPYKANRAVIFDSDLFHKTDRIDFKDGYLNRRINVTLLYGRRSSDNR